MIPATWEVEGQTYEGLLPDDIFLNVSDAPFPSIAYFCPECGRVWARCVVRGRSFHVRNYACEKHPSQFSVWIAGSLGMYDNIRYLRSLPPPLIKREFDLHLAHYDKWAPLGYAGAV